MESFDLIFWIFGHYIIKLTNLIFRTKFNLHDGGKVVTGVIFVVFLVIAIIYLKNMQICRAAT